MTKSCECLISLAAQGQTLRLFKVTRHPSSVLCGARNHWWWFPVERTHNSGHILVQPSSPTVFSSLPAWLWYHECLMLWENIEAVTGKFGKIGSTIPPVLLEAPSSFSPLTSFFFLFSHFPPSLTSSLTPFSHTQNVGPTK